MCLLLPLPLHGLLPEQLAVALGEAQEPARVVLLDGLRDEDFVAPDYRRGISTVRQWNFPADVLGIAPARGEVSLRSDALAVRAAPRGPVGGVERTGEEGKGREEGTQGIVAGVRFHGATLVNHRAADKW